MTPQPEKQTITMYIFPKFSRSKGNQTKNVGSVNRIKRKKCYIQNSCKKDIGRLLPDLFLFFKQALYEVKAIGLHFSFDILHPWLEHTIKSNSTNFQTNLQILRSNDVLNFDFSENDLGLVPSPHFMYNFFKKDVSHVICFCPNFIIRFPLLLEVLGNTCIIIICFQVYDVINFEISLSFLIKWFFTWQKS